MALLFVCMGNICRSPLAKFVFNHLARERGVSEKFVVDSCGTGAWHAGHGADPRTIAVAEKNGVACGHVARQVTKEDFDRFDLLLVMDDVNVRDLRPFLPRGATADRVRLLRSFDPALAGKSAGEMEVPDPYYGGPEGFDETYRMVAAACNGLIDEALAGKIARGRATVTLSRAQAGLRSR